MNISRLHTLDQFLTVVNFLGDDMSQQLASDIMSFAKQRLSIEDMEILMRNCDDSAIYTELSMYDAEMGGLSRY